MIGRSSATLTAWLKHPVRNFNINFGPQHPAAHGVLRLVLELDGEVVDRVDPHIGLLHRGTEKLIEAKTYLQAMPYFDRLDYVAPMNQEHAFALAVERLLGIDVPKRGQLIRVLYSEIGRILSHLLNVTTQAMDVGALTPPLWGFEEREKLMVFYERASGARMHAAYFRPGGVHQDLPQKLVEDIGKWIDPFLKTVEEPRRSLDAEPHLQAAQRRHRRGVARRRLGLGLFRRDGARLRRGLGLAQVAALRMLSRDGFRHPGRQERRLLRPLPDPHGGDAPVGEDHAPMRRPAARQGQLGPVSNQDGKIVPPKRAAMKRSMEALIHHFKLYTEGYRVPAGEVYAAVEAPKGEFGVYLVSDGTNKPYRCKLRAPGFAHLQAMDFLCRGHMLADVSAVLGSLDIVFGEVDR